MVLKKWAVINRSPPARFGLLPRARRIPEHPRLKPADYKIPYVLRPFIKDMHLGNMQHLENRGMHQEELSIERSRFPRLLKTVMIQTDGSLNEREFEFTVPPLVLLFHDRLAAHKQRQLGLAKIGKLRKEKSWEAAEKNVEVEARSELPLCNALVFPYCVPKQMIRRQRLEDPLIARKSAVGKNDSD